MLSQFVWGKHWQGNSQLSWTIISLKDEVPDSVCLMNVHVTTQQDYIISLINYIPRHQQMNNYLINKFEFWKLLALIIYF